jgi:DNA-binding Lrp family transcriptional regulator
VPPTSSLGLEKSVELLANITNVDEFIILPTLKLFKIAVKLDTTGKAKKKESVKKREFKEIELNDFHKQIIRYAQEDIDIVSEPFLEIIKKIGCSYEEFFNGLEELKSAGVLRRFATILNHRRAGFNANAMVVWDIDEDKAVEAGEKLAAFSAVSHCYLRPKYPNWSYNIFTMVHGKTKDETDSIVKEMEQEVEFNSNRYLYSTREFKKVRVKYFDGAIEEWEKKHQKDER